MKSQKQIACAECGGKGSHSGNVGHKYTPVQNYFVNPIVGERVKSGKMVRGVSDIEAAVVVAKNMWPDAAEFLIHTPSNDDVRISA